MIHVGILAAGNDGAGARVLAGMLAEAHPDWPVTVLRLPGLFADLRDDREPFNVLRTEDIDLHGLAPLLVTAPPVTVAAFTRPLLAEHLLAQDADGVLILPPDAEVYGPLAELVAPLEHHHAVLVPRLLGQLPMDGQRPDDADLLHAGEIDDAMVAVRGGDDGREFAEWWRERAAQLRASPLSAAARVFERIGRLEDSGYGVSFWNLHERALAHDGGQVTAGGQPLRLARFTSFRPDRPWWLSEQGTRTLVLDDPILTELCGRRAEALRTAGWAGPSNAGARVEVLPNGVPFDDRLRRLQSVSRDEGEDFGDVRTPGGAEAFALWLRALAPRGGAAGINRYVLELWREREDLQQAYPDLEGDDAEGLIGWVWVHGRSQLGADERLLPPPPEWLELGGHVPPTRITGYLRGNLGLGEAARGYATALRAADVPVGTRTVRTDPNTGRLARGARARPDERAYEDIALPDGVEPEVNLVCVNADELPLFVRELGPEWLGDRYTIGQWAWETDHVPERWDTAFELVDEVWVYSRYVAEHLARATDVGVPTVVVPLPVPILDPQGARVPFELPDGFIFLFAFDYFSTLQRKNPLGLIEAFKRAFEPGEGPTLLLKSINAEYRQLERERLRHAAEGRADIRLVDTTIEPGEIAALFARCDCYVSLHRSEGYGLTLAETMALGKPVIGTGFSGNTDFMTPANSYLVDSHRTPVGYEAEHYPAEGTWAEPTLEHAAALMREVWTDQEAARRRGARAAADIAATLSAEAVGGIARHRLNRIATRRGRAAAPLEAPWQMAELEERLRFDLSGRHGARRGPRGTARRGLYRALRPYTSAQRQLDEATATALRRFAAELSAERAARERDRARVARTGRELHGLAGHVADVTQLQEQMRGQLEAADQLVNRLESIEQVVRELRPLLEGARALPYAAGDPYSMFDEPRVGRVLGFRGHNGGHSTNEAYRRFEDVFRGPRARVAGLMEPYIELLRDAGPVLDVGCGRGELIQRLCDEGVEARGVDSDAGMAERAREAGLDVEVGDGVEYLEELPDRSLGAITAIHVIEHLPHEVLMRFFGLAAAKLRPGGMLIAETVNPHAPDALKTFWVDLTHQHPIFPEVTLVLADMAGFEQAFVWHPRGTGDVEHDRFKADAYAVVARAS